MPLCLKPVRHRNVRSVAVECTPYFCECMNVLSARSACWAAMMSGRGREEEMVAVAKGERRGG